MVFRNKRKQLVESWLMRMDCGLSKQDDEAFERLKLSDPELADEIQSGIKPWEIMSEYASEIDPSLIAEAEESPSKLFGAMDSWQLKATLAAACCVFFVFAGMLVLQTFNTHEVHLLVVQENEEPLTKRFEDGSVVRINKGTQIAYRFTDDVRLINIASGEAFFEVAKNPDLPFVVYNKRVRVKAVGTAFNVKVTEYNIGVSVTEGTVEISADQENKTLSAGIDEIADGTYDTGETLDILTVGEKTLVRTNAEKILVADEVPFDEEELLWKEQLSTFNGSTLEELSGEFERKTGIKLVINDTKLNNLQVVGSHFSTNDPYEILELIERVYGIEWEQFDDSTIVIGESS